ncbi:hypothetical protein B0A55_05414 [Friedmanniomyces simplex]|uniref:Uncharacterized protein n=1 Tax=Friedmanniomyces simplex TaxID=329884 RepID=A0A4U0XI05_9PEZI|nr:hypothetical protein B0A55_05414 [Friedmanniomyces simplex]
MVFMDDTFYRSTPLAPQIAQLQRNAQAEEEAAARKAQEIQEAAQPTVQRGDPYGGYGGGGGGGGGYNPPTVVRGFIAAMKEATGSPGGTRRGMGEARGGIVGLGAKGSRAVMVMVTAKGTARATVTVTVTVMGTVTREGRDPGVGAGTEVLGRVARGTSMIALGGPPRGLVRLVLQWALGWRLR